MGPTLHNCEHNCSINNCQHTRCTKPLSFGPSMPRYCLKYSAYARREDQRKTGGGRSSWCLCHQVQSLFSLSLAGQKKLQTEPVNDSIKGRRHCYLISQVRPRGHAKGWLWHLPCRAGGHHKKNRAKLSDTSDACKR